MSTWESVHILRFLIWIPNKQRLKIPKFKNIQAKFIVVVEEGEGVKLGKGDWPISSRQNNEFKLVLKSIIT